MKMIFLFQNGQGYALMHRHRQLPELYGHLTFHGVSA